MYQFSKNFNTIASTESSALWRMAMNIFLSTLSVIKHTSKTLTYNSSVIRFNQKGSTYMMIYPTVNNILFCNILLKKKLSKV